MTVFRMKERNVGPPVGVTTVIAHGVGNQECVVDKDKIG
jgi:hypothetical protein